MRSSLLCCLVLFFAAPAAAGPLVPGLALRWFDVDLPAEDDAPTAAMLPGPRALELTPQLRKRTKKSSSKKSSRSSSTLEYGAMSGRVAPMDKFIGIGVQLGAPTGVTGKLMLDPFDLPQVGVVGGIGAGIGWVNALAFSTYVDIVYHPHVLARSDSFRLSWFVGAGLWFGFSPLHVFATRGNQEFYLGFNYLGYFGVPWYGTSLGLRMPLGMSLALVNLPIEIYAEVNPALLVFPAIGGGIGASIGVRFWL